MRLNRWMSVVLAVVVTTSLALGCSNAGAAVDDATLTTRVKTAILSDSDVGGLRIDVDTSGGVVTLSGQVTSQTARDKALALARSVAGVREVKDTLQIIP